MLSLRLIVSALRISRLYVNNSRTVASKLTFNASISYKNYSVAAFQGFYTPSNLLSNPSIIKISNEINSRPVIKFSVGKGKRKSVQAVTDRFYRLHWGGWIRTIAGRNRKLYKKSFKRKQRLKQHVFCNATQSTLLDKMVGPYWRKPRYYVDDPYEPYHSREEFVYTARKPKPYFPPED